MYRVCTYLYVNIWRFGFVGIWQIPLIYNFFCTCDMDEHMTFFMSHMTILYMYWFITLRHMTFFASHMTNLMEIILPFHTYGTYDIFYVTYDNFVYVLFITLRAYDIFCIAYDKLMEIILSFHTCGAYDICYVAYDNFDGNLNFNVWRIWCIWQFSLKIRVEVGGFKGFGLYFVYCCTIL